MIRRYEHLNRGDLAADDPRYNEQWRSMLGHLGTYVEAVVGQLNLRPTDATLLSEPGQQILIRLSTPDAHWVLRIAPEGDLAGELFFSRTMERAGLPVARIAHHDLRRLQLPFAWVLEAYIGGHSANHLEDPLLLHALARQVGRALRRMHRIPMPAWGRPNALLAWGVSEWPTMLARLHHSALIAPFDAVLFNEEQRYRLARLLEHPTLHTINSPLLIHGALSPHTIRYTGSNQQVQLAAFVDPGPVIAGDPMLDLAIALDPDFPPAWCRGLREGYGSNIPLSANEAQRLDIYMHLTCAWNACQHYARGEPFEAALQVAITGI